MLQQFLNLPSSQRDMSGPILLAKKDHRGVIRGVNTVWIIVWPYIDNRWEDEKVGEFRGDVGSIRYVLSPEIVKFQSRLYRVSALHFFVKYRFHQRLSDIELVQMSAFSAFFFSSRMNPCFAAMKQIRVWNCHVTCGLGKFATFTSTVCGFDMYINNYNMIWLFKHIRVITCCALLWKICQLIKISEYLTVFPPVHPWNSRRDFASFIPFLMIFLALMNSKYTFLLSENSNNQTWECTADL